MTHLQKEPEKVIKSWLSTTDATIFERYVQVWPYNCLTFDTYSFSWWNLQNFQLFHRFYYSYTREAWLDYWRWVYNCQYLQIDWSIGRYISSIHQVFTQLIDWLIDCSIHRSVDRSIDCSMFRLLDRSVDWLIVRCFGCSIDRLIGWLISFWCRFIILFHPWQMPKIGELIQSKKYWQGVQALLDALSLLYDTNNRLREESTQIPYETFYIPEITQKVRRKQSTRTKKFSKIFSQIISYTLVSGQYCHGLQELAWRTRQHPSTNTFPTFFSHPSFTPFIHSLHSHPSFAPFIRTLHSLPFFTPFIRTLHFLPSFPTSSSLPSFAPFLRWFFSLNLKFFSPFDFQRETLSFCNYPFTFDPAAKTLLLEADSRLQMEVRSRHCIFSSSLPSTLTDFVFFFWFFSHRKLSIPSIRWICSGLCCGRPRKAARGPSTRNKCSFSISTFRVATSWLTLWIKFGVFKVCFKRSGAIEKWRQHLILGARTPTPPPLLPVNHPPKLSHTLGFKPRPPILGHQLFPIPLPLPSAWRHLWMAPHDNIMQNSIMNCCFLLVWQKTNWSGPWRWRLSVRRRRTPVVWKRFVIILSRSVGIFFS